MSESVNVSVIYYSSTGSLHQLAQAVVEGAEKAGARTRLRRVAETAPAEAINSNEQWAATVERTKDIPEAGLDDLEWADVVLLGSPTRYGNVASQMKQFIDTTGPLWQQGKLADKVYSAFTSTATAHGGQESTLLTLATVFYHWGGIMVPPGYTDPIQFQLGNPYGTSAHVADANGPDDVALDAARYQARRAVHIAAALKEGLS